MGLKEKRVMKAFIESDLTQFKAELEGIIGFLPDLEIEWDDLIVEGEADYLSEKWNLIYFKPILESISDICSDDLGKEAIQSLKQIKIINKNGVISVNGYVQFENGILVLDHRPTANADGFYFKERVEKIKEVLEAGF